MKHIALLLLFISAAAHSQKNFIDQPYLETSAKVDTLVTPDRIYLNILVTEKDTKGKISVEELEIKMANRLKALGIDIQKQLTVSDVSSNFRKYFLKQRDVLKAKAYSLLVYNADTAGQVIIALEDENISNVSLERTEYSKAEALKLTLKGMAISRAKQAANSMLSPLGHKAGALLYVSDSTNPDGMLQGRAAGVRIRGIATQGYRKDEYKSPEIEFEKIKIVAEVQAIFKIE